MVASTDKIVITTTSSTSENAFFLAVKLTVCIFSYDLRVPKNSSREDCNRVLRKANGFYTEKIDK